MVVETVTFLLEDEGATKSLCVILARVAQGISSVFFELLARKVGVSEWVLQQEPKCLGKLLQVLLRAVSLMDIFMKMQPPVSFSEGLPLPNFICESLHPHASDEGAGRVELGRGVCLGLRLCPKSSAAP